MLRPLLTVIFSAGLFLTAGVGGAVADSDCRTQGEQQSTGSDPRCEQEIRGSVDATDETTGDPTDNTDDQPDGEGQASDDAD